MFRIKLTFSRKENLRCLLKRWFGAIGVEERQFLQLSFFGQRSKAEFSQFSLVFFLVVEKPKTLKLAKTAFMKFRWQETVRKQHRHNSLWGMYTFDLTINSHTNPYNLASSRLLWFKDPRGLLCCSSSTYVSVWDRKPVNQYEWI